MSTPAPPTTLAEAHRTFWRFPNPWILAALLIVTATLRSQVGPLGAVDLLAVVLVVAPWPLQEWLIHTQLLHFRPRRWGPLEIDLTVAAKHRRHHRDPAQLELVFMPIQAFLIGLPVVVTLWLTLAPTLSFALSGLVTYLAFSLHYEWVHFLVHTRYRPRSWLYARLWKNHRLHHYRNEQRWYGVTMLAADTVLGTSGDKDSVPASATCRDLFGESEARHDAQV